MERLRNAVEDDVERILELNESEVRQTSALERTQLASLVGLAAYSKVMVHDDGVVAFLIALRESAPYDNANHRWFAARVPTFLYVDRVVVDARVAGRGVGRRLYADLFAFARAQGVATVACEYNLDPPNPASRAFHARFGFREIGTRWNADRSKCVSMQCADVVLPTATETYRTA